VGEGREERRGEQRGCTWLVWKKHGRSMEEAWKKKKNGVDALQGVQKMSIRVGFGE
jgi:hypothetical protein